MMLSIVNNMMGIRTLKGYLPILCAAIAGVVGYITFVQAELMNAKTIASLLPFFVVSGVSIAGLRPTIRTGTTIISLNWATVRRSPRVCSIRR